MPTTTSSGGADAGCEVGRGGHDEAAVAQAGIGELAAALGRVHPAGLLFLAHVGPYLGRVGGGVVDDPVDVGKIEELWGSRVSMSGRALHKCPQIKRSKGKYQ